MKKLTVFVYSSLVLVLLVGCTEKQSFEEFFDEHMEHENRPYDLIHTEENVVNQGDAIAVFRLGEQIWISYFKSVEGSWVSQQARGAGWNRSVNWTVTHELPYIYSGAISDNEIAEVHVDNQIAKIIDIDDNKRFWYLVNLKQQDHQDLVDAEVIVVKKDGTEELVKRIDR